MLTKQHVQDATRYNAKRVQNFRLDINELPWPLSNGDTTVFVWATALFQSEKGLTVDGKFGPATQKKLDDTSVEKLIKPGTEMPGGFATVVAPDAYSNVVIANGLRHRLPEDFLAAGLSASNYIDDGEVHFKHRARGAVPIHFVLHETCGNTASGCVSTLQRRGYGVQLIMAPSGHLQCHGDLVRDRMVHANHLNETSFGIEVVNPYAPKYVRDNAVFADKIPAEWWTWCPDKKDRRYVTPTRTQMAAIRLLAPWLCEISGVPFRFPTSDLSKKKRQISGLDKKPKAKPGPGIVAHRDFASHSDGRYMLEDLIGRT